MNILFTSFPPHHFSHLDLLMPFHWIDISRPTPLKKVSSLHPSIYHLPIAP